MKTFLVLAMISLLSCGSNERSTANLNQDTQTIKKKKHAEIESDGEYYALKIACPDQHYEEIDSFSNLTGNLISYSSNGSSSNSEWRQVMRYKGNHLNIKVFPSETISLYGENNGNTTVVNFTFMCKVRIDVDTGSMAFSRLDLENKKTIKVHPSHTIGYGSNLSMSEVMSQAKQEFFVDNCDVIDEVGFKGFKCKVDFTKEK
jgi:hypothetical protein